MNLDYGVIGENYAGKLIRALYFRGNVDWRNLGVLSPLKYDKEKNITIYKDETGWILNRDREKSDFLRFYEAVLNKPEIIVSSRAKYYCDWLVDKIDQDRKKRKEAAEKAYREAQERAAESERMRNPDYRVAHTECPGNCSECYFCTKGYGINVNYCKYLNDIYKKRGYEGIAPCDWYGRPILACLVTHESIITEERPDECPYLRKEVAV